MKNSRTLISLLIIGALIVGPATMLFAGGAGEDESEEAPQPTVSTEADEWEHPEAPMLRARVEAGDLPPLEERLPADPRVTMVENEIGTYGDVLFRGGAHLRGEFIPERMTSEPPIQVHYPYPSDGPLQANVARDWEFNDDGTEMTLYLREGMKWSDGEPFTADDMLFYWHDVIFNENSPRGPDPNLFVKAGEPPELEKIDDYTVRFTFPEPYFFFETVLASQITGLYWPKHYLEQYHPDYNSDATWEEFAEKSSYYGGRGRVVLSAWMLDSLEPGSQLELVRNPYYWHVDPEGNQLPYFDRVVVREFGDRQAVALAVVSGEIDVEDQWVGLPHLTMFLEEEQSRPYEVRYGSVPGMAMYFNYDAENQAVRTMVRNTNFRRAFSLAIDRPQLNEVLFYGLSDESAGVFSKYSPYHNEDLYKAYAEHDPAEARRLLDQAGFRDRNRDGVRELPSGADLEITIDVSSHDLYEPAVEMIVEDLAEVGINAIMNVQHQELIEQRRAEGSFEIHVWDFYGVDEPLAALEEWAPVNQGVPYYHQDAYDEGSFSPEHARFVELLMSARSLPYEQRVETVKEANRILAENVFVVHTGYYSRPYVVSDRIGNVPDGYVRTSEFGSSMPHLRFVQSYPNYPRQ